MKHLTVKNVNSLQGQKINRDGNDVNGIYDKQV